MRFRQITGLMGAVALVSLEALAPTPVAAQASPGAVVPIIVVGDAPLDQAQVDRATAGAGRITGTVPELGATLVDVPAATSATAARRLDAVAGVDSASPDHRVKAFDRSPLNNPYWEYQDSLRAVNAPAAWGASVGSPDVVIAIIDSGVNPVDDLAGRVLPGRDFVNDDNGATDDSESTHGTDSALVAAAAGDDTDGGAGMCWTCRILPVKVLDSEGSGSMYDVARGIVWAVDHGADVINLSLGGTSNDQVVAEALTYAFAHDVLVVASAGNDGTDVRNYPAAAPGVLSVTANDIETRALYPWAQRGPTWVDVAAPGCNYVVNDGGPYGFCGTSSSSPLVAGLAGLLRAIRPTADRQMVATAIVTTADFAPTAGQVGYGIIDAGRAAAAMPSVAYGPTPPPADVTVPTVALTVSPDFYKEGTAVVNVVSDDDQYVSLVDIVVDGQGMASVANPARSQDLRFDTTRFGDGPHEVVAYVNDVGGHRVASAPATIRVDNLNPAGILTNPTNGAKVSGPFVTRVFVTDPNGIMGTFLIANGAIVGGFTGSGWGQATVPVSRSGTIRVVAITVDNAGHISGTNQAVVTATVRRGKVRR